VTPTPTLLGPDDVAAAAAVLAGVAERTPVQDLGPDLTGLAIKREDLQPIGAFKLRGAYHAASRLAPERRAAGLVTHSSGNHGRALAWVAQRLGVGCTVVVPDDAVESKVAAMVKRRGPSSTN
jgi:threonine dehydratase